jgi:hypothetical protein
MLNRIKYQQIKIEQRKISSQELFKNTFAIFSVRSRFNVNLNLHLNYDEQIETHTTPHAHNQEKTKEKKLLNS